MPLSKDCEDELKQYVHTLQLILLLLWFTTVQRGK